MRSSGSSRRAIFVGVVVHTDVAALHATLAALAAACRDGDGLLIVADGPDDEMATALRSDARLRAVRQRVCEPAEGNAAAFNIVASERRPGDGAVVFIESGSRPAPDAFDRLCAALEGDGAGLAGPSTNDAWNEQCALADGAGDAQGLVAGAIALAGRYGQTHRPLAPLHSIAEFCFAVSAEALAAVGAADTGFGLGPCWEMEYAARAARAGLPAVWVGAAYVHRGPATPRRRDRDARHLAAARRHYQDRLCGLRLAGNAVEYDDHCAGDACQHFAPADRVEIHRRPQPAPASVLRGVLPPLVSCVMPTGDRPEWVRQAIGYFQRQDYPARELVIVDDGAGDLRADLGSLLDTPGITHLRLPQRGSIGAKRNIGCQQAKGAIIVQWDDDDWYGPNRISRQVAPVADGTADISGFRDAPWFDIAEWRFRRPSTGTHRLLFVEDVHGGTLGFSRQLWDDGVRYPNLSLAEDAWFLRNAVRRGARLERLAAAGSYVYVRHGANSWQITRGVQASCVWDDVAEPLELAGDRGFYARRSGNVPAYIAAPPRPTVSCIMPTADRRRFVPAAIAAFAAQRDADAELVVVDDGREAVGDLLPPGSRMKYVRLDRPCVLGEKRNLAIEAAAGEVIVHFDDDDWSHPDRVRIQIETLRAGHGELCGLNRMLWWDPGRRAAWRYTCPPLRRPWVAGNTLAYLRSAWNRSRFPAQAIGEDTAFVWGVPSRRAVPIADERLVIGTLHDRNTSTKNTISAAWSPVDAAEVLRVFADSGADVPWVS